MCYISKEIKEIKNLEKLTKKEKEYVLEIGEKTWQFFKDVYKRQCLSYYYQLVELELKQH